MSATIKDIARETGLALATISKYINSRLCPHRSYAKHCGKRCNEPSPENYGKHCASRNAGWRHERTPQNPEAF